MNDIQTRLRPNWGETAVRLSENHRHYIYRLFTANPLVRCGIHLVNDHERALPHLYSRLQLALTHMQTLYDAFRHCLIDLLATISKAGGTGFVFFLPNIFTENCPDVCSPAWHESCGRHCVYHHWMWSSQRFLCLRPDLQSCCLCAVFTVWAWCCWSLTTWWSSCSTLHASSTSATRTSRKGIDQVRLGNNHFCSAWAAPLSAK